MSQFSDDAEDLLRSSLPHQSLNIESELLVRVALARRHDATKEFMYRQNILHWRQAKGYEEWWILDHLYHCDWVTCVGGLIVGIDVTTNFNWVDDKVSAIVADWKMMKLVGIDKAIVIHWTVQKTNFDLNQKKRLRLMLAQKIHIMNSMFLDVDKMTF